MSRRVANWINRSVSVGTSLLVLFCVVAILACAEQRDVMTQDMSVEPVATLGSGADSISVSGFGKAVELESGEFLVIGTPFPRDRILYYSGKGRLLGTLGKPGDGPGEFRHIVALQTTGDSAISFQLTGRISSIAADRSIRTNGTLHGLVLNGWVSDVGDMLVSGNFPGHERAPVYRVSNDRLVGVGSIDTSGIRDAPSRAQRHAAFTVDGHVWLVRPDRYELELYDLAGNLIRTIDRNVAWFPDRDYELAAPPAPPSPFIIDLAVDFLGRVLVLARVANEPYDANLPRGEGIRLTPEHMARLHDGIIEVIDPASGQPIASHRSDVPYEGFASSDKIFAMGENADGVVVINVWRLRY